MDHLRARTANGPHPQPILAPDQEQALRGAQTLVARGSDHATDDAVRLDDPPTVTFAPATDTLYYEDGDGVIRRFTIDRDATVRLARSLLTRGFTPDECVRYFPGEHCPTFDE